RFMIQSLGEALGKEPIIDRLPEQPGDVRLTYADVSRAKDELGYAPATPFQDGLRLFVDWFRSKT
ncbi:epimerase, partial [Singulisphaera rosea]